MCCVSTRGMHISNRDGMDQISRYPRYSCFSKQRCVSSLVFSHSYSDTNFLDPVVIAQLAAWSALYSSAARLFHSHASSSRAVLPPRSRFVPQTAEEIQTENEFQSLLDQLNTRQACEGWYLIMRPLLPLHRVEAFEKRLEVLRTAAIEDFSVYRA
jgi:hypothetical protein